MVIEENRDVVEQRAEVARHSRELEEALAKLKEATKRPLGLADRIRDDPVVWLGGALLVGLWLGSGSRNND